MDRLSQQVFVDFEPLSVERDCNPEPWITENRTNGVRVNTGDDSFLPTPLETTYSLRYRTSRQLGFFDQYEDRKSTRLNSSHVAISYAGFCLEKKKRPELQHKKLK